MPLSKHWEEASASDAPISITDVHALAFAALLDGGGEAGLVALRVWTKPL